MIRIGIAGWGIGQGFRDRFPTEGTVLERYAARFSAVEVNSSFHRPHRRQTYERWAASVPSDFRFAVKAPRTITHERRLVEVSQRLNAFLGEIAGLGDRLGAILIQLPPSLALDIAVAGHFFRSLRDRFSGLVAVEPRHASWFDAEGDALLASLRLARVAADPPLAPQGDEPGGWLGAAYFRLHGSPRIYHSEYGPERLAALRARLTTRRAIETWCIFDNTTRGAATADGLALQAAMSADHACLPHG